MDLQGAGHWLLHEILRLEQAEVLDAFRVCSVQLTYNFAYFACIGYSMPLQPPTNLLRTKHTNSNHHAENLGKNSAFSKTLRKSKGIFTHRKKKQSRSFLQSRAIFQLSWPKWTARPCDNEEDTSMSWEFKIKFYGTEGTWRNIWRNNWKKWQHIHPFHSKQILILRHLCISEFWNTKLHPFRGLFWTRQTMSPEATSQLLRFLRNFVQLSSQLAALPVACLQRDKCMRPEWCPGCKFPNAWVEVLNYSQFLYVPYILPIVLGKVDFSVPFAGWFEGPPII